MILFEKVNRRIHGRIVSYFYSRKIYPFIYPAYWHYLLFKSKKKETKSLYYAARPNPGAGIGHQMANWIAGYWFAQQFGMKFAHLPFAAPEWDEFLGFGYGEKRVEQLEEEGYKVHRLPLFNEDNPQEVQLQRDIMASYAGQKVVFIAEQDQFYKDQFGVMEGIQRKFYGAPTRANNHIIYGTNHFNIAIHVRRGDIMTDPENPNLVMRYLSNDYFERVLSQVLEWVKTDKPKHIYFFSQGKPEDFPEFYRFNNLHWCINMGAQDSFLHMVYADLLITSKSSFSYKPALLNRGIKVCPKNFWHGYPDSRDWILCDNEGNVEWKL